MPSLSFLCAGVLCAFAGIAGAQVVANVAAATVTTPPSGYARTVVLWPDGAPGAKGNTDADVPKLFVYPAAGAGPHSAVIVLPGGGYKKLVMEKEGAAEAKWLNAHGVTAFVLQYRLGPRYLFPAPMQDGARAIRYVRSHAAELDIVPNAIGVWGFSAGGHLAGYLATVNDAGDAASADPIDRVSDRPDFAILSYARLSMDPAIPRSGNMEGLLGENPTTEMEEKISVVRHVTGSTSPSFIYSTTGDQTVNSMNATAFYDALKRAGVPAELHIFEHGPHGTGMAQGLRGLQELSIYPVLIVHWMEMHGWMEGGD